MANKVLIITYYWPPVGGSGVQRWLKMSRYLEAFGWEPVIYTPENPSFGIFDESQLEDVPKTMEVIRLPIWEPYQLFAKFKGKQGIITASDISIKQKKGFFDKISLWIRANFFIPDPRVFWVKPSVKFLPAILKSNEIDAVITTGPPHSLHLIGRKLKKKTGITWIADFRDPWTEWDLFKEFPMLPPVRQWQNNLERKVLQDADEVFTNNSSNKNQFEKIGGRSVSIISNGYDEADFKNFHKRNTAVFNIRHVGIIDEMRDPAGFIPALKHFLQEHPEKKINIEFIGNVVDSFKEKVLSDNSINKVVSFKPYQPHKEIIRMYEETDVLLLVLANSDNAIGNIPGKVYEYIASGARILALGPEHGEIAEILSYTRTGKITDHNDVEGIHKLLNEFYELHNMPTKAQHVEEFSRRVQAGRVAKVLDRLKEVS